jgi:putative ABC transport system permease protein
MLKNYFIIALRNLLRQRIYTVINVIGLATGVASCLMIVMFVANEFSYDKFHSKHERIYKMGLERKYPTHSTLYAVIPHSYGDAIQSDFAEVEQVVKFGGPFNNNGVTYKDENGEEKTFEENFVSAADSNFFSVFDYKILKGNPQKPFEKNTDVVLTKSTANRYFGAADPLGKTLRIFGNDFTVSAVCEDIPENSHMQFDFLVRWNDQIFGRGENFTGFNAHIYLLMKPEQDPKALEAKFPKMVDTYAAAQIERNLGKSWADYKKEGNGYRYFLQPLDDIHLDPIHLEAKIKPGGNLNYVYFLTCIAVLVLVIACINFMNLATARSAGRAREVGVRKSLGSKKGQLVNQFLLESILLSVFSTLIAVFLIYLALPSFNSLTGKHLTFSFSPLLIAGLALVTIFVGVLAGIYPAFVLSAFNPVTVLKGNFSAGKQNTLLRNSLVVFQFLISIILIVGTITVGKQMEFMRQKSLGYDKEQVIVIDRVFTLQNSRQSFLEELKRIPEVVNTAGSFALLGGGRTGDYFGETWTAQGSSEIHTSKTMTIDDDFGSMIGFEVLAGNAFSKETNDSLSLMLNETAVKVFELGDPIGKKLSQRQGERTIEYTIIGVVKDFNFQSLHDNITPLTIRNTESFGGGAVYAYVRVKSQDFTKTIASMEKEWKKLSPQPFKYFFLDESINQQYQSEKQAGDVFKVFSILAIIIACVGLFGLAAYTASLRTKEIGVRKVLGASVPGVVLLLSKDFTRLILIAFVLAVPLGWYLMERWLQDFAYRIDIGIEVFLLAGLIALMIGWLTVSYQSIKAAIMDPVKALRSE